MTKWQSLTIPDIVTISILGALMRVIIRVRQTFPVPMPFSDWISIFLFSYFCVIAAYLVLKPGTVYLFFLVNMLVNFFLGGAWIWSVNALLFPIIPEFLAIAFFIAGKEYLPNNKTIYAILLGVVVVFSDYLVAFGLVYPVFLGTTFASDYLVMMAIAYLIIGSVGAILGYRTARSIKPLVR